MGYLEDLQALRLIKAFLKIEDAAVRRRIVEYVEAQVPPQRPRRDERVPDPDRG